MQRQRYFVHTDKSDKSDIFTPANSERCSSDWHTRTIKGYAVKLAMKRTSLLFALLFSSLLFAQSPNPYVTIGGKLQGPNGLPASNQILSFTPTQSFFVAGLGSNNCNSYLIDINGTSLVCDDTINFNNSTPSAPTNGINIQWQTSKSGTTDSVSAAIVGDGNASHFLNGTGGFSTPSGAGFSITATSPIVVTPSPLTGTGVISCPSCGTGSGGGNPTLDNCTPDETGNSFYSVTSLTNYFYASWQFVFNTTTYFNCTVYVPTAQTGATLVLDIASADSTAGHTANFQTCDGVVNTGTINLGSALTCASAQTFTTTSTAYNRVSLTFNVQSTLANGSLLAVKIGVTPAGTAPTQNLLVYPHFIL